MISTNRISFRYPGQKEILHFPDIACSEGNVLLITGNSGSGKTTLLSILGGLLRPETGSVLIGNVEISCLKNRELDKFRGQRIGFVLQQHYFIESVSVYDNLMLAATISGKKTEKSRVMSLLDRLNITSKAGKRPGELSVGERQRLGIARALINNPSVVLADEPTSSLDNTNCDSVVDLLRKAAAEHQTAMVIVTHDQRLKTHFNHQTGL